MKFVFAILGVLGLAISCVQGVAPFIEVTKWVAWVSGQWVQLTRVFWHSLLDLFGIAISRPVADLLSGVVYTLSLLIGFRRLNLQSQSKFFYFIEQFASKQEKLLARLRYKIIRYPVGMALSCLMFLPYLVMAFLIYLHAPVQAVALAVTSLLLNHTSDILPAGLFSSLSSIVFGTKKEDYPIEEDDRFAAAYLVSSFYVVGVVLLVLAVDRIALNADRIIAAYDWARCDAGIDCTKKDAAPGATENR